MSIHYQVLTGVTYIGWWRWKSAGTILIAEMKQSCRMNREFSSLLLESLPIRMSH